MPTNRGFTLIETFIAITILLLAVLGPMSLVSRSISDAGYAANQITAFYLAQEGLELVINHWEDNSLNRIYWLDGFDECVNGLSCKVWVDESLNFKSDACVPIGGQTCDNLLLDKTSGVYGYDSGDPTPFTRTVSIKDPQLEIPNDLEDTEVDVTVVWKDKGVERTFTLSTIITNNQ